MDWKYFEHELNGAELSPYDEETECYYEFVPSFIEETGHLPMECRECFKALIFWTYSRTNFNNFERMLESLPVPVYGKYNDSVVVFYFREKKKMLISLNILKKGMNKFGVEGRIQWRVSGQYWQNGYPEFFRSAKELKPVHVDTEITMEEWLKRKDLSL